MNRHFFGDTAVLLGRSLRHIARSPDTIITTAIMPVALLLLFVYVFGGAIMFLTGWFGDKYRVRGPIIVFNMLLCLIGVPLLGWVKNGSVRYFGIFLVTAGANANVPTVMTYQVGIYHTILSFRC